MKKRFKMIITVAMLACSMALMGFGVYAASSHTLTVNNYIQFSVGENIAVTIDAKTAVASSVKGFTETDASGTQAKTLSAGVADPVKNETWTPWTSSAPASLTVGTEYVYWIFKVTNNSTENSIKASVLNTSDKALTTALTGYELKVYTGEDAAGVPATAATTATITKGNSAYILVQLKVSDNTKTITGAEWNFKLKVEKA